MDVKALDENLRRKARNVTVLSFAIYVYIWGNGTIGDELTLFGSGITFENEVFIFTVIGILFFYYKFRYDIVNQGNFDQLKLIFSRSFSINPHSRQLVGALIDSFKKLDITDVYNLNLTAVYNRLSNIHKQHTDERSLRFEWLFERNPSENYIFSKQNGRRCISISVLIGTTRNVVSTIYFPITFTNLKWLKIGIRSLRDTIKYGDNFWEIMAPSIHFYIALISVAIKLIPYLIQNISQIIFYITHV